MADSDFDRDACGNGEGGGGSSRGCPASRLCIRSSGVMTAEYSVFCVERSTKCSSGDAGDSRTTGFRFLFRVSLCGACEDGTGSEYEAMIMGGLID